MLGTVPLIWQILIFTIIMKSRHCYSHNIKLEKKKHSVLNFVTIWDITAWFYWDGSSFHFSRPFLRKMSLVLVTAVAPYMETFWRPLEVVRNVLVKCQSMRSWRATDHSLRPIHLKWLKHSHGGPLQNSDFQASVSIKTTWRLIPQVSGLHTQSFWFCAEVRPANLHF